MFRHYTGQARRETQHRIEQHAERIGREEAALRRAGHNPDKVSCQAADAILEINRSPNVPEMFTTPRPPVP